MRWNYYIQWSQDHNNIRAWSHTLSESLLDDKMVEKLLSSHPRISYEQDPLTNMIIIHRYLFTGEWNIINKSIYLARPNTDKIFLIPETHPWFNYGLIFVYFNDVYRYLLTTPDSSKRIHDKIARAITADLNK